MNKNLLKTLFITTAFCYVHTVQSEIINNTASIDYDAINNSDVRLNIEQNTIQKQRKSDNDSIKAADDLNSAQKKQKVTGSIGAVLYQYIQQKNWRLVRTTLVKYESTQNPDPLLVNYAKGSLARVDGDYKKSVEYLKKVIKQSPKNFLLPQLALARVQFEDNQDKDSQQTFKQLSRFLDHNNPQQQGVIKTVELFNTALEKRQGWQGSIAIGISHNNNINQSSGVTECLHEKFGLCLRKVTTPKPISAKSIDYEGVLSRRFALSGNHGAFIRGIAFGKSVQNNPQYNKFQGIFSAGYNYKNANNEWSLSPTLSYSFSDGKKLYSALGANGTWLHSINRQSLVRIDVSAEDQKFIKKRSFNDGIFYSTNLSYWQTIGTSTTPFIRASWSQKKTEQKVHSYREKSLQLGVNQKVFQKFSVTAQARVSSREHDAKNAIFGIQQKELIRDFSLKIAAPHWDIMGLEPSFKVKYSKTKSNIDWMYSHDKTELSIRLEKRF